MKNSEYWKARFGQLEAAQNRKGAEVYAEIERQYKQAQKEIEAKIDAWYRRFADNNGVSMAEARRMLMVEGKFLCRIYVMSCRMMDIGFVIPRSVLLVHMKQDMVWNG